MRKICTRCLNIANEGTNWCQTKGCPPGTLTSVFDYNDHFGSFTIQEMVRVFRTSTLYVAQRPYKNTVETVFLKVAHSNCQSMLKFEARLLSRARNEGLLELLPPLPQQTQQPYSKIAVQGELRYFLAFSYIDSVFLRDMIIHHTPSEQHAIWITVSLANTVAYVHKVLGALILGLTPDSVLIHIDKQGTPRPYLVDYSLAQPSHAIQPVNYSLYGHISYLAPEQLKNKGVSPRTDVYGMGLLLYEMLAGKPAFDPTGRREQTFSLDIFSSRIVPLKKHRPELHPRLIRIVDDAIHNDPLQRFKSVGAFARALQSICAQEFPAREWNQRLDRRTIALVVFLLIVFLSVFVLLLLAPS